ncbi:hypothetical protein [Nocardiopsis alba]|uniref:hypothetical protein n=1 Tax=Nocardiopsis alba TaxID=53437 RepID=UPI003D760A34
MTDNNEAPRGPHRTGPVLSSTGEASSAKARDAIGAPAEQGQGQTAPYTAPTPTPAPTASVASETAADGNERGRRALLSALTLRGNAAKAADGAEKAEEDRYRPGRPVLAVAAIAGLMLVAAPFGLSAAKEHQNEMLLQGDLASGAFPEASGSSSASGLASDSASASSSGTGVQGYVPEVQPNSPILPGAGDETESDPSSGGGGAEGSSGGGLPERPVDPSSGGPQGVPPAGGADDEDDDEDGTGTDGLDGEGGGVTGEPQGVTVEKGSLLDILLNERNGGDEDSEKSEKPEKPGSEKSDSDKDTEKDGEGDAEGEAPDGVVAEPLTAQAGSKPEPGAEGTDVQESEKADAEEQQRREPEPQQEPEPEPDPEPEPEPESFFAVSGPGCSNEGARYRVHGDGVWRSGPSGYTERGCVDGYDVMSVSGDPDGGGTSAEWTFWPNRPGSTCTVKILVQNGPEPLWANGVPMHYELFDGDNTDGGFRGGFEVTEPDGGRYWALTEFQPEGNSFTLRARNRGAIPEGGEAPQLPISVVETECR